MRLSELAHEIGAELYGNGNIFITQVASIGKARKGHITFLKDSRFRDQLSSCSASAVILSKENLNFRGSVPALVVQDPYLTYIKIAYLFNNTVMPITFKKDFKQLELVAQNVICGKDVEIGYNTIIESGVILKDQVKIGYSCFIGKNTHIGMGTYLHSNVTIYHDVEIGDHCVIQSGSVLGSDGFGYIQREGVWIKIPHLGSVRIENSVEIGSCTTIDRGTLDDTYIESGVIIDNQCQIAHNVRIGEYTAIAGSVVIAGSVNIGKYCMIGGASVINGHINICDKVTITGMSMVIRNIKKPGIYSSGVPIQPNFVWRRTVILIMNIHNMYKRLKMIEKKTNYFIFLKNMKVLCFSLIFILVIIVFLMKFL